MHVYATGGAHCMSMYVYLFMYIYIYSICSMHKSVACFVSACIQMSAPIHSMLIFVMKIQKWSMKTSLSWKQIYISWQENVAPLYVYIYIYTHTCIYMYIHSHLCAHRFTYTCVCTQTHVQEPRT